MLKIILFIAGIVVFPGYYFFVKKWFWLDLSSYIGSAILYWTFLVIWFYALETKKLREEAQRTNELATTPFIDLKKKGEESIELHVTGQGSAVACIKKIELFDKDKKYLSKVSAYIKDDDYIRSHLRENVEMCFKNKDGTIKVIDVNGKKDFFIKIIYDSPSKKLIEVIYKIKLSSDGKNGYGFTIIYSENNFF